MLTYEMKINGNEAAKKIEESLKSKQEDDLRKEIWDAALALRYNAKASSKDYPNLDIKDTLIRRGCIFSESQGSDGYKNYEINLDLHNHGWMEEVISHRTSKFKEIMSFIEERIDEAISKYTRSIDIRSNQFGSDLNREFIITILKKNHFRVSTQHEGWIQIVF
jgi:hypothetical protein